MHHVAQLYEELDWPSKETYLEVNRVGHLEERQAVQMEVHLVVDQVEDLLKDQADLILECFGSKKIKLN